MRVLVLSNLYPPAHLGGYEMLCQEVVDGLAARGHELLVLASDYRASEVDPDKAVERTLRLESDVYYYRPQQVLRYWRDRAWNLAHLRSAVDRFRPDVVSIWGMWNLSTLLAQEAERLMGDRVFYYLANAWPIDPSRHRAYWDAADGSWRGRAFRAVVRPLVRKLLQREWELPRLHFCHVQCCSAALCAQIAQGGAKLGNASIVYEGIDLDVFHGQAESRWSRGLPGRLDLVYVGSLIPHKGVHTAIQAFSVLSEQGQLDGVHLTILGSGHPDYEAYLHELVWAHDGLSRAVTFHAPISRAELPGFLARFDGLVMPSIWQEPLARVMQDALASGLPLIATPTGGTREIVVDGENGLLFAPEDCTGLAGCIARLAWDVDLRRRLGEAGVRTAKANFDMRRMVDDVESALCRAAAAGPATDTPGLVFDEPVEAGPASSGSR